MLLFPLPLGPTNATVFPAGISKSRSLRTGIVLPGYAKLTPRKRMDSWSCIPMVDPLGHAGLLATMPGTVRTLLLCLATPFE